MKFWGGVRGCTRKMFLEDIRRMQTSSNIQGYNNSLNNIITTVENFNFFVFENKRKREKLLIN